MQKTHMRNGTTENKRKNLETFLGINKIFLISLVKPWYMFNNFFGNHEQCNKSDCMILESISENFLQ